MEPHLEKTRDCGVEEDALPMSIVLSLQQSLQEYTQKNVFPFAM